MKILTRDNANILLIELGVRLKDAGDEGLPLAEMEAADAYLAGVHSINGDVALVTRGERQFVVWLKTRARNAPVFRVEEMKEG